MDKPAVLGRGADARSLGLRLERITQVTLNATYPVCYSGSEDVLNTQHFEI
jgi:hypothetical protein